MTSVCSLGVTVCQNRVQLVVVVVYYKKRERIRLEWSEGRTHCFHLCMFMFQVSSLCYDL